MKLKGQTAIVTGGGRGIGRAICLALAGEGADVVIAARTGKEIRETARLVERKGGRALAVKTDLRVERDVKDLISKAVNAFGRIDILVNNAGVAYSKYLVETSTEEYDEIMDTNVKGIFYCTKYALPQLLKRGNGRIINIASEEGKRGVPKLSVYCASKFAIIGLTEALAYEVGGGLQVYAVCPAGVDTRMYHSIYSDVPTLKPEDVAKQVLALCLPETTLPSGSSVEVYSPPVRVVF
ncbi:oxidoreductase [Methanosarcina sp. 2.H.T.1A.6]|uniref:SDR family NAD(P)-dependent oxidoreductase n=1 Tax=unclassified Methanosarcina TaxID=2644672 RepID=UPI000621F182|nr:MULTISPECIES: SDR family oxidoreductase [unclassified Methanosarcina]KKG17513.1 oxidoreductase [Methanosarcina sp. 2.H.T.1A.15]KKG18442.1 oxidoreductase [Methanosarcina sp. 2.H.T.1A.3]KKG20643.1 oxidoreductase [Methanosarcina sp. 2.H.T.1A.6]KKG23203.1 oxidoreductase [Methanosarcina sp. 2.H.T.1A.8]